MRAASSLLVVSLCIVATVFIAVVDVAEVVRLVSLEIACTLEGAAAATVRKERMGVSDLTSATSRECRCQHAYSPCLVVALEGGIGVLLSLAHGGQFLPVPPHQVAYEDVAVEDACRTHLIVLHVEDEGDVADLQLLRMHGVADEVNECGRARVAAAAAVESQ